MSAAALVGRAGEVAVGIRPEKIQLGRSDTTCSRAGPRGAYVGVSTQYIVQTAAGAVTVYVQNTQPGAAAIAPGTGLELSFAPEATFVVDGKRAEEEDST